MSDVERLLAMFDSGQLLRPSTETPGIVDFSNALAHLLGVEGIDLTPNALTIRDLIGSPEHLVLVVADGFGMNFVEEMDRDAFVPSHVALDMLTVFPSTTPAALTSLATGQWPSQHAVTGWYTFMPALDDVATIIRYQRASDEKQLSELGVPPEQAFPLPSKLGKAKRSSLSLMPEDIANSAYSRYWNGNSSVRGYKGLRGAADAVAAWVRAAREPSFTYLYVPDVDRAAHELGTGDNETWKRVGEVNQQLERLSASLPDNARLVMIADHGHLDTRDGISHSIARPDDELLRLSTRKPSGDIRLLYLTVEDDDIDRLRGLFKCRYGDDFLIITTEEAEHLGLLGPDPLSAETRSRLGNLIAISTGAATLDYREALGEKVKKPGKSHHSGMTPAEMRIPLVVA